MSAIMSVRARLTDACLHWQRESQRFSPDGEYRGCAKIVGGLGGYSIVYYDSRDEQTQWGIRIATTAAGALLFLRRHCREWHTHKRPKPRKKVNRSERRP